MIKLGLCRVRHVVTIGHTHAVAAVQCCRSGMSFATRLSKVGLDITLPHTTFASMLCNLSFSSLNKRTSTERVFITCITNV